MNVKKLIKESLEGNIKLKAMLSVKDICLDFLPTEDLKNKYPYITFSILSDSGKLWADDREINKEILLQIDIWGKSDLTSIGQEVTITLVSKKFIRKYEADLFEKELKVFHKAIRFLYFE